MPLYAGALQLEASHSCIALAISIGLYFASPVGCHGTAVPARSRATAANLFQVLPMLHCPY
jgi:hypothetical protein